MLAEAVVRLDKTTTVGIDVCDFFNLAHSATERSECWCRGHWRPCIEMFSGCLDNRGGVLDSVAQVGTVLFGDLQQRVLDRTENQEDADWQL